MKRTLEVVFVFGIAVSLLASCVSTKKFTAVQEELGASNKNLEKCKFDLNATQNKLGDTEGKLGVAQNSLKLQNDQIALLKEQLADAKALRDKQLSQVGDLTVLSQSANDNIKETLSQLEKKDKYIQLLQAAKSKADSINLALAVNLKSVLKDGIEDNDVEVKVDKTVVFVNLSDKMLYQSGSSTLTPRANEVLAKIAQIIESRPELEVMVEGYTDNQPIKNGCIDDNWDLSVKRATSVVRALQTKYGVD
ncbi:MAG: OmpA family protein, partial [Bacteroidia bacterium]